MIRVRIEGTEQEIVEFLERMPEIPGFEKTHVREPKKGNNPKYDTSKNVLAYLSYKKMETAVHK
ncbi:YvzF family protein [Bacillus sp. C1]